MSFRDELDQLIPRLRRYARALVAAHPAQNELADDLVRGAVQRVLELGIPGRWLDVEVRLYSALTELHREALRNASLGSDAALKQGHYCASGIRAASGMGSLAAPRDKLSSALAALVLDEKEALLLVVLERFDYARAARVLKIPPPVLIARLSRARQALCRSLNTEPASRPHKARPSYLRLVK